MERVIALILAATCAATAQAAAVTVNFDTDAYGNPLNAPSCS